MKLKKFLSFALAAVLLLCSAPAAFGETLIGLGTVTAGTEIDMLIPGVTGDNSAVKEGSALPSGCRIETELKDGAYRHYLRGTPLVAGNYSFELVFFQEGEALPTVRCSLTVMPAAPTVSASSAISCYIGDTVCVSVTASSPDGSTLSYQWYSSSSGTPGSGTAISGAVSDLYSPPTASAGIKYYYCTVTSTSNELSSSTTSVPIQVRVTEPVISSVSVLSLPGKLNYRKGETLDASGLKLRVYYGNGTTADISEGFELRPVQLTAVGEQEITVSYGGCYCSFKVTVEEEEEKIVRIEISSLPSKLTYTAGERLDTTGMVVRLYTNLDNFKDVTSGFSCDPVLLSTVGTQTVKVNYGSKSCTFTVTVKEKNELKSLSLASLPTQTVYTVGDSLNTTGLSLSAVYSDRTDTVTSGFSCSPTVLSKAGVQPVTVSFNGKECSFNVTVNEVQPTEAPQPTAQPSEAPVLPTVTPVPEKVESGGNHGIIVAVLIISVVALIGLGAYFYLTTVKNIDIFKKKK